MKNLSRILPIVGFSILSGFFGLGATWIVVMFLLVCHIINDHSYIFTVIMPVLITGGIIGFVIGLVISLRVSKANPQTEEAIENKYVGFAGRVKIYFGAPMFVTTILGPLLLGEKFLNKVGTTIGVYLFFGSFLAIVAASLVLYDRIPKKFIVPIGIIGWLLTILLFVWLGFFGRAAFGH